MIALKSKLKTTHLGMQINVTHSFLAGRGRNRVYGTCCSAQMAHKPVQQSRQQALRAYCSYIYTLGGLHIGRQTGYLSQSTIVFALKLQWERCLMNFFALSKLRLILLSQTRMRLKILNLLNFTQLVHSIMYLLIIKSHIIFPVGTKGQFRDFF